MHTYWTSMLWSIDSCQKQGIHWSVSLTPIAGSGVDPSKSSIFWSYPLTSYYFSNDRRLKFIFQFIWNMLCLCAAQLRFWFQTDLGRENSASYYRQGRQLLLTLLTMVTRWSRSTSNFYALIGQNLTGEFMRKIYAASWMFFSLTAEADRVLCQLVMFFWMLLKRGTGSRERGAGSGERKSGNELSAETSIKIQYGRWSMIENRRNKLNR